MSFFRAHWLNADGQNLKDEGKYAEAEAAYRAAAAARPKWSVPWYNLGLMQKYRGRWEDSLECNLRATALAPGDQAAWWNLGIAATATSKWAIARRAWRSCGIDMPDGDGPPTMDFGHAPVRLPSSAGGEVVWASRIDPARAVVGNVPLPTSGYRWRDVVLNDGAANGHRIHNGKKWPVFDVLERIEQSGYSTYIAEAQADTSGLAELSHIAERLGGAAEDWSASVRMICQECSESTLGYDAEAHKRHANHPGPVQAACGIAARDVEHAHKIVDAWLGARPGTKVQGLRLATESRGS